MANLRLLQCLLYKNRCYLSGQTITPTKIVLHSTGADNDTLRRYVQPHSSQATGMEEYQPVRKSFTRQQMLALLGTNRYANDWNRDNISACVNAFIGRLADDSVAVVQTLPWTMRPWGVGSGSKGSYNNCAIQFEICEDDHSSAVYCKETFEMAAQLCAHLMRVYPTITEIVSHHEAYQRGFGSGHTDPDNWWPKHGLSMDKLRARVQALLAAESSAVTDQMYRIRLRWDDPKSQIGAYRNFEYAKAECKEGYTVFDKDGNAVYSVPAESVTPGNPGENPGNIDGSVEKPETNGVKIEPAKNYSKELRGAYMVTAKAGLHLRVGARTDQPSIAIMPYAAKVQCYGFHTGNWLNVSYNGKDGYCHKDYLKKMEALPVEKPVCHCEEAQPTWQSI